MSLTDKEKKFCEEYTRLLDKAKAARAAGYSIKSARKIGYENWTKPDIQQRIKEIQAELQEKTGVTAHSVIMELAALAYWNIKDFLTNENRIKDLSKMQKSKLKPVIGVKVTETTIRAVDETTTTKVVTEIKLSDKRGALVDLGRHLGIFEEDNRQQAKVEHEVSFQIGSRFINKE